MALASTRRSRVVAASAFAASSAFALAVVVGGEAAASAGRSAEPRQEGYPAGAVARSHPQTGPGSTLFATWGTVTNGDSSANAAEHRRELAGGHAGSANAAEAPAFTSVRR